MTFVTSGNPFEHRGGMAIERGGFTAATRVVNPPGWSESKRKAMLAARLRLEDLLGGPTTGYRACVRVLSNNSHQLGLILENGFRVLSEGCSWLDAFAVLDVLDAHSRARS